MTLVKVKINDEISLAVNVELGVVDLVLTGQAKPMLEWVKAKIPGKIDDAIIDVVEKWLDSQNPQPPTA